MTLFPKTPDHCFLDHSAFEILSTGTDIKTCLGVTLIFPCSTIKETKFWCNTCPLPSSNFNINVFKDFSSGKVISNESKALTDHGVQTICLDLDHQFFFSPNAFCPENSIFNTSSLGKSVPPINADKVKGIFNFWPPFPAQAISWPVDK